MKDYKKKYEEALERAKIEMSKDGMKNDVIAIHLAETIFPELKESEEERIRKGIFKALSKKDARDVLISQGIEVSDALAWLEKQGEQEKDILEDAILDGYILDGNEDGLIAETIRYKHEKQSEQKSDKVEPKFKVGDRIRYKGHSCDGIITEITDTYYICGDAKLPISTQDKLELIEQKPADKTPYPETLEKAIDLYYYSYGNGKGEFEHLSLEKFRDIVYTFVSDYGQKPVEWSEDDDNDAWMNDIISKVENNLQLNKAEIDWLKFIKDQVQLQLKHEYNEEDEQHINSLLKRLDGLCKDKFERTRFAISEDIDWLKSIKKRLEGK